MNIDTTTVQKIKDLNDLRKPDTKPIKPICLP